MSTTRRAGLQKRPSSEVGSRRILALEANLPHRAEHVLELLGARARQQRQIEVVLLAEVEGDDRVDSVEQLLEPGRVADVCRLQVAGELMHGLEVVRHP